MKPAEELREAACNLRADASWPSEDFMMALADWLEQTANRAQFDILCDVTGDGRVTQTLCKPCGGSLGEDCVCGWDEALKVARSILGT